MTTLKNISFAATLLLALAACSSDNSEERPDSRIPIKLTSSNAEMELVTRSSQELQNDGFDVNEQLDVIIEAKDGLTTYDPQIYKVNSLQGQLVPISNTYSYFPINGSGIDIRAIYPKGYTSATQFTVETTQTDDNSYKKSDLMFASKSVDVAQSEAVPLTFYHKLTKIQVNLTATGSVDLNGSIVKLLNLYTTAGFDPATGTVGEPSGNKTNITMSNNGSEPCAAIIVPQSFSNGYLIEIRLANNDILNWRSTQTIPFEGGKVYTYNIEVTESNIKVTSIVEPWITTTDISGRPRL